MKLRQWLNAVKFFVWMAGGDDYLQRFSLKQAAHYHLLCWDAMSTARQLMHEMSDGAYLRGMSQPHF